MSVDTANRTALASDPPATASAIPPTDAVTILYGSQTGNAEYLAHEVHERATGEGTPAGIATLEDWLHAGASGIDRLLVVTSTHDNGHMPDNAEAFWGWLQQLDAGALDGLPYAVLAIGDSMYDDFCKAGRDIDERLAELGAVSVIERIDCDVDFDMTAPAWTARALAALQAAPARNRSLQPAADDVPEAEPRPDESRNARVAVARPLSAPESSKHVLHVELELDGPCSYAPGDSIAVFPQNHDRLVDEWMALFGPAAEAVELEGRPLREFLRDEVELRLPHAGLLVSLARLRPDNARVRDALTMLQAADRGTLEAWLRERDVLEVLRELGCTDLAPDEVLAELRPLQRRDYSISSSPARHGDRIHLTVSTVGYEAGGRRHAGCASAYLAERAASGEPIRVRLLPAHEFRLPEPERPIIMIGPGVGVAPFRAFLHERASTGASGRNWLVFGDRRRSCDRLYGDEFDALVTDGVLTRFDVAFSRDQEHKHYVQDELLAAADELRTWVADGASVFVCGDKARMAVDVEATLTRILASSGDDEALQRLRAEGRYVKDVY